MDPTFVKLAAEAYYDEWEKLARASASWRMAERIAGTGAGGADVGKIQRGIKLVESLKGLEQLGKTTAKKKVPPPPKKVRRGPAPPPIKAAA